MTREEAIAVIRKEYKCVDRECDIERSCGKCDLMMPSKEPILQAYDMAIQALSQEPCEKCEVGNPCLYCEHEFSQKIEPMRDFTKEEAKAYSKALDKMYKPTGFNVFDEPYEEIDFVQPHKKIPITLDLTPCDDAISRQSVLDLLATRVPNPYYENVFRAVDALPPVTHKSGKWIAHADGIWITYYECSECRRGHNTHSDYCPNCGAYMVESQESEEQE